MAAILVIDGNPVERRIVRMTLEVEGHAVREAESGNAALEALRANTFDVIMCAMNLADMSGYKVIELTKTMPGQENTPFIAMLEKDDERGPIESFLSGAIELLIRPFGAPELREAVQRLTSPQEIENRRVLVERQLEAFEIASRLQEQAQSRTK